MNEKGKLTPLIQGKKAFSAQRSTATATFRTLLLVVLPTIALMATAANVLQACAIAADSSAATCSLCGSALFTNGDGETNGNISITLSSAKEGRTSRSTITNEDGSYCFKELETGSYLLYASAADSVEKSVHCSVTITSDNTTAPLLELTGTGAAKGRILLDGKTTGNSGFIIFIAGSTYMAATADDGSFAFENIPVSGECSFLVMRGSNTLFLKTASLMVRKETDLGDSLLSSEELQAAAKSLVWKGNFASSTDTALANPEANWAYYNTTDCCSYVFNGTSWTLLSRSGTGIIWKGTFSEPPENPELNWTYFNSTNAVSYIWDGTSWQIFSKTYTDETAPASVTNFNVYEQSMAALLKWEAPKDKDLYGIIVICTQKDSPVPSISSLASLPPSSVLVPPGTTYYLWPNLATGETYLFSVYACDAAGNKSEVSRAYCYLNPSTPGGITITPLPETTTLTNKPVTVNVICTTTGSAPAVIKYTDSAQPASFFTDDAGIPLICKSGAYSFTVSANGVYTIYAKDTEGRQKTVILEINNIDTDCPEQVQNLCATYNKQSGQFEFIWKQSPSSDVQNLLLTCTSPTGTTEATLAATDTLYGIPCAADGSHYTLTICATDRAGNKSQPSVLEADALSTPVVFDVTLSKSTVSTNSPEHEITVTATGKNFYSTRGNQLLVQVLSEDTTPYALSIHSDTTASGKCDTPYHEGTYKVRIVYKDEELYATKLVVLGFPIINNLTLSESEVTVGEKGCVVLSINGTNFTDDFCPTVTLQTNIQSGIDVSTVKAKYINSTLCQAYIPVPSEPGVVYISTNVNVARTIQTQLNILDKPTIQSLSSCTTTLQHCGLPVDIWIYGTSLSEKTGSLSIECNGKEYPVNSYHATYAIASLNIPIVATPQKFYIYAKVNGVTNTNTVGEITILSSFEFLCKTEPLITMYDGVNSESQESGTTPILAVHPFQIGKHEVTEGLWNTVYKWALNHGYIFSTYCSTASALADNQLPVRMVSWRDCIVWCNAYTEWTNEQNGNKALTCVYYTDDSYTTPLKQVSSETTVAQMPGSSDMPYVPTASSSVPGNTDMSFTSANGYRLPTQTEWEYAARKGKTAESWNYTYAGSSTSPGWCKENSYQCPHQVGMIVGTSLGVLDLSGNVWEWTADWAVENKLRMVRGGSYENSAAQCAIDYRLYGEPPYHQDPAIGFRVARNFTL
jgi:formylglycine-generating enzyme required for sulfatase activity